MGGCLTAKPVQPPITPETTRQSETADWFSVYFTDPDSPSADRYRGGPDAALAAAIDQARMSIEVAVYDFDLWSLQNALLDAHQRGVAVRVVTESDNLDRTELQELAEAGIPVLGDRREGLMHNKFVIIDRQEVWSGSMNFTVSEAYQNNNNLLRIRSSRLAENYLAEFDEMFLDDQFGPGSPNRTPHPRFTVDDTEVEVYFSPDDNTAARLVELINNAEQSIYFMVYSFTADDIAAALIEQTQQGVSVAGVLEDSQVDSNIGTDFDRLRSAGVIVRLDGNPDKMHHKVMIIDEQIVVTGSYNFSASAEKYNDENTLIIHDPEIASQYIREFERVFMQAQK
jgi:phosphatidylserine/phosphatidylglycerophosphate/cardiolipin synthase-like enzyme